MNGIFFRRACWIGLEFHIIRYLMANTAGRLDGAEKSERHREICRFYIAIGSGDHPDVAIRNNMDAHKTLHRLTQDILTDRMDEVIGFPLESTHPDYDMLSEKFFGVFHDAAVGFLEKNFPPQESPF